MLNYAMQIASYIIDSVYERAIDQTLAANIVMQSCSYLHVHHTPQSQLYIRLFVDCLRPMATAIDAWMTTV